MKFMDFQTNIHLDMHTVKLGLKILKYSFEISNFDHIKIKIPAKYNRTNKCTRTYHVCGHNQSNFAEQTSIF